MLGRILNKAKTLDYWDNNILFFIIVSLFLRILLSFFGTLELDYNTFLGWSNRLVEVGFSNFYESWSDYLPGYLYILYALGKLKTIAPIFEIIIYKLPAILADLGTGYLLYCLVGELKNKRVAFFISLAYLFNPAILANSTLWGQVDSLTIFMALLSFYLLKKNIYLSSLFLALGVLIKPQAALAAPVILFVMLREKWKLQKMLKYVLFSAFCFVVPFFPFKGEASIWTFVFERLSVTLGQYPYTSVNAFSFWGLWGFWQPDTVGSKLFGALSIMVIYLLTLKKLWKVKNGEYYLLAIVFLSGFLFMTRMHERHLLPALAPILLASSLNPFVILSYLLLSITYIANLAYSYVWITQSFKEIFSYMVRNLFIITNLFSLIWLLILSFTNKIGTNFSFFSLLKILKIKNIKLKENQLVFPKLTLTSKRIKIFLYLILIFSFVSRTIMLWYPKNEYFDEVYHAFTAKLMLHADPKAWEWWNPHPEGFAYEWTHPPLAKSGMALGMKVFGENAFGWRFPGVLLGVASIYLVYLLAKEIFKDEVVGLLSALMYSLDGLVFVMSRIGMNDTYFVFFMLLALYLFIKERNFFSSLCFGLSLSSKWSAIYAAPIFLIIFLVYKKKIRLSHLFFFLIPPLIYLLSYTQMFLTGHAFDIFTGVQKQMWWYHTNLRATHAYTSPWWSWPLLLRPVYLFTTDEVGSWVGRIYNLGNPMVFWFGLTSFIFSLYELVILKNRKLALIVFSYLIFFVPWALSPRIMFFYHYLPSVPFLAILTGYTLRRQKEFMIIIPLLSLILFVYFYPHWTGIQVPIWLDSSYYWFSSWR